MDIETWLQYDKELRYLLQSKPAVGYSSTTIPATGYGVNNKP